MQFDTLEIQKKIEEKRLIFGQKFEKILLINLTKIVDFCGRILAAKKTALFGTIFIIAVSILAQSSRDLGHDSATYPEIAQKMLAGGEYFTDFFESNLPLNFLLTMIPVSIAQKFDFNVFATAQIFWNLLGILSLIWSAKILRLMELNKNQTVYNLVILAFAAGFFWRVFTLQFNELGTKSTYLLAALFPYISYQLLNEKNLRRFDQILRGSIAAFLFCLKPHYGIFVIILELQQLIKARDWRVIFCLRNRVTLGLMAAYLLVIFQFFPDYLANISTFSASYYDGANNMIFFMLMQDILPFILLFFLCFEFFLREEILRRFLSFFIAATLLILAELIGGLDQRFVLYSVALPLVILLIFFVVKSRRINWQRDGLILMTIILLPQFDPLNVFSLVNSVICFWWILAFYILHKWQKLLPINKRLKQVIIALAIMMILALITGLFTEIPWLISAASLVMILCLQQNFYEKHLLKSEFSRLSSGAIFVVLSYLISLNLAAIFNFPFYYDSYKFKSPNYFNSEVIKAIKHYTKEDESVLLVTMGIPGSYPAISYAGKKNELPFLQYEILFKQITADKILGKDAAKYMINRIKKQLALKENKLFLVESHNHVDNKTCAVTMLEYYLRDPEFRKIFLENYIFLTRITNVRKYSPEQEIIDHDAEIYLRK